jgi:hypothetical protein
MNCPNCHQPVEHYLEAPYFKRDYSGIQPGPADDVHLLKGIQTCSNCKHEWTVEVPGGSKGMATIGGQAETNG